MRGGVIVDATGESDPRLAKVYTNLAAMEERHIAFWEARLRAAGRRSHPAAILAKPGAWRDRAAIRAGAGSRHHCRERGSRPERLVKAARNRHDPDVGPGAMAARVSNSCLRPNGAASGQFLGRWKAGIDRSAGMLWRAAVLGANDGLCSNLSLVMEWRRLGR